MKNGHQWFFGKEARTGVDRDLGPVHVVDTLFALPHLWMACERLLAVCEGCREEEAG